MTLSTTHVGEIVEVIASSTSLLAGDSKAILVAISGIDASGKGTIARHILDQLKARGIRVALIGLDPWHHPAEVRFSDVNPGEHFFRNAFRFDELFEVLIEPLELNRSVTTTVDLLQPFENEWYSHTYDFFNIDVIVVEGIFLLKRELRGRYNLSFWVECSFGTALRRALRRNQEGLPEEQLIADYGRIYFPAQRIHLARDWPKSFVDGILAND
jgi:uridine kinase